MCVLPLTSDGMQRVLEEARRRSDRSFARIYVLQDVIRLAQCTMETLRVLKDRIGAEIARLEAESAKIQDQEHTRASQKGLLQREQLTEKERSEGTIKATTILKETLDDAIKATANCEEYERELESLQEWQVTQTLTSVPYQMLSELPMYKDLQRMISELDRAENLEKALRFANTADTCTIGELGQLLRLLTERNVDLQWDIDHFRNWNSNEKQIA